MSWSNIHTLLEESSFLVVNRSLLLPIFLLLSTGLFRQLAVDLVSLICSSVTLQSEILP